MPVLSFNWSYPRWPAHWKAWTLFFYSVRVPLWPLRWPWWRRISHHQRLELRQLGRLNGVSVVRIRTQRDGTEKDVKRTRNHMIAAHRPNCIVLNYSCERRCRVGGSKVNASHRLSPCTCLSTTTSLDSLTLPFAFSNYGLYLAYFLSPSISCNVGLLRTLQLVANV